MNVPEDRGLMQFVRDRRGNPRGVVVSRLVDERVTVGWSFTNYKAGDRFDKQRGIQIALGRLTVPSTKQIPYSVHKVMETVVDRSKKYFKTSDVRIW